MKMQNMYNARIIIAIMALFLSGCTAKVDTLVYDKPVQQNESAVLVIPSPYTVTSFDGQPVKWTISPDGIALSERAAAIRLPSGRHNIAYSYYLHEPGQTTYEHYASGAVVQRTTPSRTTAFDGNVTLNMEPGKRYRFEGRGIFIDTNDNYDKLP